MRFKLGCDAKTVPAYSTESEILKAAERKQPLLELIWYRYSDKDNSYVAHVAYLGSIALS
jgi:hypothetical protein